MKRRVFNWILAIDIVTILMVMAIVLIPSSLVRVILGLPFLLFFPGYVLLAALFPENLESTLEAFPGSSSQPQTATPKSLKRGIDHIERTGLSLLLSVAISSLLGYGLNYSPWGIKTLPVLLTVAIFILLVSVIAFFRQPPRTSGILFPKTREKIRLPFWEGSLKSKTLTVGLTLAILVALGFLGYTVAYPHTSGGFDEFYILGNTGKINDYPTAFILKGSRIESVQYGEAGALVTGGPGYVTVGIVNHGAKTAVYAISMSINGEKASFEYNGIAQSSLEELGLPPGEKWEGKIGFSPLHSGNNQKVEILFSKEGVLQDNNFLQLWIDVTEN